MVRRGEATTCNLKSYVFVAAARATSNSIAGVPRYSAKGETRVKLNRVKRGSLRVKVKETIKGKVRVDQRGMFHVRRGSLCKQLPRQRIRECT